jgi:hypothetical protein
VAVIANETAFDVVTYLKGAEVDRQTVSGISFLAGSAWVDFSGAGDLAESAGIPLVNGTNGTADTASWTGYFAAIKGYKPWNTMAVISGIPSVPIAVKAFIQGLREDVGRKVQAVVLDYPGANYEGIISVDQGFTTLAGETVSPELFTAFVAGLTAGSAINKSNTYAIIPDADFIIGEADESNIPDLLRSGHVLLSRRQDGAIVVEQDINTFTAFSPDKGREFSKNRVIRTIDGYANDIRQLFEAGYIGKVSNNAIGRDLFKADVISYLTRLQDQEAIQNFDSAQDIKISAGVEIDEVVLDLWIQPVDAMEKLYNKVYLRVSGEVA